MYLFINENVERSPDSMHWFTRSAFSAAAIKETEKAYQVKNNREKTMWLPKKGLKNIDGLNDQYTIAPWFKRKLENWQVTFLQS